MILEIVKLYSSSLSRFFTLSDVAVSESRRLSEELSVPPFVPSGSTSLIAAFFASRIVDEVNECSAECNGIDSAGDVSGIFRKLLDSLRWRMLEAIAALWARGEISVCGIDANTADAKLLHYLEDWDGNTTKAPARYLDTVEDLQTRLVTSSLNLASRSEGPLRQASSSAVVPLNFKRKIKNTFVDTLCFLFDGVLSSATSKQEASSRHPSRISSSRIVTIKDVVRTSILRWGTGI